MKKRDHGGGLAEAINLFGGLKNEWIDLSTGINPNPYPMRDFSPEHWARLPDKDLNESLILAARRFWQIPENVPALATPGLSSVIALLPYVLGSSGSVHIPRPTYNEYEASFENAGWLVSETLSDAMVIVHPNNPTGKYFDAAILNVSKLIIDESFCDLSPERTLLPMASRQGVVVLKSFGKFWGLAGLRLGFAIGDSEILGRLAEMLGPWAVSGPALVLGQRALSDTGWAETKRHDLRRDSAKLDNLMDRAGIRRVGGTELFGLYKVPDAKTAFTGFAQHKILTRIFPYSDSYLRLGLPRQEEWDRVEEAIKCTL